MKKVLVFACALFVAGPGMVLAQAYNYYPYSGYGYGNYSSGYSCIYISSNLSLGSRGSEVSTLQQFLVNQNYPGAGSWMVTGYFGRATEAAVRTFQVSRGLLQTGIVDAATRSALGGSCFPGLGAYYPYSTYTSSYQVYPYNSYPYVAPLRIDSLSTQSALAGTQLTIYGSGFDQYSNTVRFGTSAAAGTGSTNGTQITVTVPNMQPGTYGIYVTNGRGVSNSLAFTVTGNPYSYYNNYGYNYGNYYPYNSYNYPYMYGYNNYNYGYNYNCSNYPYNCY